MAIRRLRSSTLAISSCVRTTPLGKPVVPEVYMMKAVAAGSTARARAAKSSAETPVGGPAGAPPSTGPAWGALPRQIARATPGTNEAGGRLVDARRDFAKGVARGTEHEALAVRQAGRDVVREIAEAAPHHGHRNRNARRSGAPRA